MMKIDNSTLDNKSELELFAKKQKNLVATHERELDGLEKNYKAKEKDLHERTQDRVSELADLHKQTVAKEIEREESYLQNFQKNLQNQKALYEKSLSELRDQNELELGNIQTKHKTDLENKFSSNLIEEKSLNNKINFEKKSFHEEALRDLRETQHKEVMNLDRSKYQLGKETEKARQALSPTSSASILEQKELTRQKHETQLEIDRNVRMNNVAQNQMKTTHEALLKNEEKVFNQNMQTKQTLFNQKYKETEKTQTDYLADVQKKFEKELQKISADHAEKKSVFDNKVKDSFYRVSTLAPRVEETERDYIVTLPISEHEKDNVQLTAQGRQIHLGMTRRFNDQVQGPDGSKSTSSRSETVAKEFSVPHILDSKKVTQKYEEGKVIFKIAKL